MKRFFGSWLALGGGTALVWGIASVLTGTPGPQVPITNDFSVTARTGGLAGAVTFTVGLIWLRD